MQIIASAEMRQAAGYLAEGLENFVCHALTHALVKTRGFLWSNAREISDDFLHPLLIRDGLAIDGSWNDAEFGIPFDSHRQERIEWCLKIADELDKGLIEQP